MAVQKQYAPCTMHIDTSDMHPSHVADVAASSVCVPSFACASCSSVPSVGTSELGAGVLAAILRSGCRAGGLLDLQAITDMIDSDAIGALGLDVHWQEPWDPTHSITNHPKSVC